MHSNPKLLAHSIRALNERKERQDNQLERYKKEKETHAINHVPPMPPVEKDAEVIPCKIKIC